MLVSLIETSRWTNNEPQPVGCNTLEFFEKWFDTKIDIDTFEVTIEDYYCVWVEDEDGEGEYQEFPATFSLEA